MFVVFRMWHGLRDWHEPVVHPYAINSLHLKPEHVDSGFLCSAIFELESFFFHCWNLHRALSLRDLE